MDLAVTTTMYPYRRALHNATCTLYIDSLFDSHVGWVSFEITSSFYQLHLVSFNTFKMWLKCLNIEVRHVSRAY